MKKTFALLVASTALSAALGLPAFSALHDAAGGGPGIARPDVRAAAPQLILASDDDDDDDDDCEDDDGDCRNGGRGPAPAGTVAPPQNGLFGNGAPPQVQVN